METLTSRVTSASAIAAFTGDDMRSDKLQSKRAAILISRPFPEA